MDKNYYDPLVKLDLFIRGNIIFYISTESIFDDLMQILKFKGISWCTGSCATTVNYNHLSDNLHLKIVDNKIFPTDIYEEKSCIKINAIDLHAIKNYISEENYKIKHAKDKKHNNNSLQETISKQRVIIDSLINTIRRG